MTKRLALGLFVSALTSAGCTTEVRTIYESSPTEPEAAGQPGDGDGEDGSPASGTTAPKPSQPGCAEEAYSEALPSKASLAKLTFSQATANDYLLDALGLRYPVGKAIVEGGLASPLSASQGSCIDRFLQNKSSAQAVLRQATTVVHECGHFYDLGESQGSESAFVIRPDNVVFACKAGDTTTRGGKTFARSLINGDDHYSKRKACAAGTAQRGCDSYAGIYLDGDASDGKFDSGDQGYSSVLEEASQYVNSLATALAFQEAYAGTRASERDGILTFLWYIERYLAMARTDYPQAYALLSEDPCWRQATLTVWDRGWFYLKATKGMTNLGIDDAEIEKLVNEPSLVGEIDALRKLECK